jgi:dsRNA-specific ribonuclease
MLDFLKKFRKKKEGELDKLRNKIINGKVKDINDLKKTNGVIKVMIEKGELSLKIVKSSGSK